MANGLGIAEDLASGSLGGTWIQREVSSKQSWRV